MSAATDPPLVLVDVEVDGARRDVRVEAGVVVAVAADLARGGARVVAGRGGVVLPGLHDHHLHLLAMAAADRSLALGGVRDADGFDRALAEAHHEAPPGRWLRVVGYDDRHGPLDRHRLDRVAPGRPIRVQHRSGAAWVVSSPGLEGLDLDGGAIDGDGTGLGRDADGTPTGWLHRLDDHLTGPWADLDDPPDLTPVGRRLAGHGITGVTDATPSTDPTALALLATARRAGALPQHVAVTGGPALATAATPAGLGRGPVKVVVTDHVLPSPDALAAAFTAARRAGRSVAVHCVTRIGLVLALAAWDAVGAAPGDRVEHASVVPVELIDRLAALGVRVVTQPGFIAERGDAYLDDVEADDVPHLYRCRSLLDAGIPVAGSTDAPFGPDDPWTAVAAATERRAPSGRSVGRAEALDPVTALGLFLGGLHDPGGPPRRVEVGAPADLVLLDRPLGPALAEPSSAHVRATWIDGVLAHDAEA